LFCHTNKLWEKDLSALLRENDVVRAVRITGSDCCPNYDRFIPKAEFITGDNRFSPAGIEWLYLALGPKSSAPEPTTAERCALAECRAAAGERFALCNFSANDLNSNAAIVDLSISDDRSFYQINYEFDEKWRPIFRREVSRGCAAFKRWLPYKSNLSDAKRHINAWATYTYAKLLSEQIFVPVESEDKSLMYAPFQCMAQYFLSEGYCGIVYGSTVFPGGKNVVLFDKEIAHPCGEIRQITIPSDF
jgi:hypothetical protein